MPFPPNPTDGEIIEVGGVAYQYHAAMKAWYRISTPTIPLATPSEDGLMSAEDFKKLTGLIIPPPQITITTEDCDNIYSSGLLTIKGDIDGIVEVNVRDGNLHENTGVIDFKLDTGKLANKLISLGQLRITSPQGDPGEQGDQGNPGDDYLPVGPQGPDGKDGTNAPWPGSLSEETFDVAQQGRAIVDISTRQISQDENYIVVKRANIGNPESCPDTIVPQDIQSPWLLAFDSGVSESTLTKIVSPNGTACGWACNSKLYYFDVDIIIQDIYDRWLSYMQALKANKEQLASDWLAVMMAQFNDQKAALCCAIEACKSRSRNVDARRYLETQRTTAALGGFKVVIGGEGDKVYPPGTPNQWNTAPTNYNMTHLSDPNCVIDWTSL